MAPGVGCFAPHLTAAKAGHQPMDQFLLQRPCDFRMTNVGGTSLNEVADPRMQVEELSRVGGCRAENPAGRWQPEMPPYECGRVDRGKPRCDRQQAPMGRTGRTLMKAFTGRVERDLAGLQRHAI